MVVCLEIVCKAQSEEPFPAELLQLLKGSHDTWAFSQVHSAETSKAAKILEDMLTLIDGNDQGESIPPSTSQMRSTAHLANASQFPAPTESFLNGLVGDVLLGSEFGWYRWDCEMQRLNNMDSFDTAQ
ncbi:hypothetical protein BDV29DRAFT_151659 [Aspergillus leporis]|uniref:Uncharacterized protein n=1 Tax=Aspergillus leporis TaxID=41062 RepID=A0A5N5XG94_9EURO|nr:hypothetical protein BDV29DRAFT_151659 [Aspergillus leporis]